MDFYRKADVVIFSEGSACHGTELMGTNAMNHTFVIPRREGQMYIWERVLSPRSKSFSPVLGCIHYLGSAVAHPELGSPLSDKGTSWIDIEALIGFFRLHNIARLANLNQDHYIEAATHDFDRYLCFQSQSDLWNDHYADEVKLAFDNKRRR